MSKLLELMRRLGSDAALALEYAKDPEAVLKRVGLSEEECTAMLQKDYAAIKRLTGLTEGKFAINHLIHTYEDKNYAAGSVQVDAPVQLHNAA